MALLPILDAESSQYVSIQSTYQLIVRREKLCSFRILPFTNQIPLQQAVSISFSICTKGLRQIKLPNASITATQDRISAFIYLYHFFIIVICVCVFLFNSYFVRCFLAPFFSLLFLSISLDSNLLVHQSICISIYLYIYISKYICFLYINQDILYDYIYFFF